MGQEVEVRTSEEKSNGKEDESKNGEADSRLKIPGGNRADVSRCDRHGVETLYKPQALVKHHEAHMNFGHYFVDKAQWIERDGEEVQVRERHDDENVFTNNVAVSTVAQKEASICIFIDDSFIEIRSADDVNV